MAQAGGALQHILIEVSSDDDSEDDEQQFKAERLNTVDLGRNNTAIDIPADQPRLFNNQDQGNPGKGTRVGLVTEAACLQMVINVLPAILVDYVLNLIRRITIDQTRTVAHCEAIILRLLEGAHPTEADAVRAKKRKREDSDENVTLTAKKQYHCLQSYNNDA